MQRHSVSGVTVPELLTALAVVAILATLALPGFAAQRRDAALVTAANRMVGSLHRARTTAILRAVPAVVCLSADGERCLETDTEAANAWLVFLDHARSTPIRRDPADELLARVDLPPGMEVRGTRTALVYWPVARAGTTGTFGFCYRREGAAVRSVVVSQTGRPRVAATSALDSRCA